MKRLTERTPQRQLSNLHAEMDDLFASFFGEEPWRGRRLYGPMAPPVESFVKEGQLVVRADLPGVDPADVELTVEGDRLTIKGERKSSDEGEAGGRLYREVTYGRFERSLALPSGVDPDSVKASYTNGVLEITMNAPGAAAARKIPIKAG